MSITKEKKTSLLKTGLFADTLRGRRREALFFRPQRLKDIDLYIAASRTHN